MRLALLVVLLLVTSGCGSSHRTVTVSATGRIGPLQMDQSTRADVIAFAGRPDAERHSYKGRWFPPFRALGYDCAHKVELDTFPLIETPNGRAGPDCRTVFWISARTGKLGDFFTSSTRYSEVHGVRIGMGSAVAERLLHRRLTSGCEENIYLGSREAPLTVAFTGGVTHMVTTHSGGQVVKATGHVTGARVFALVLHGRHSEVGIFDCL